MELNTVDGNTYRKLITDINEKVKLILEAHGIGHEGYNKITNDYEKVTIGITW